MSLKLTEDIRSVTELKRHTREIIEQVHRTGRPVVLTVNGKADAVIMDAKTYEKHLRSSNMLRLLATAEEDVKGKRVRSMRSFLKKLERMNCSAHGIGSCSTESTVRSFASREKRLCTQGDSWSRSFRLNHV